jgi:hypothetical protein
MPPMPLPGANLKAAQWHGDSESDLGLPVSSESDFATRETEPASARGSATVTDSGSDCADDSESESESPPVKARLAFSESEPELERDCNSESESDFGTRLASKSESWSRGLHGVNPA